MLTCQVDDRPYYIEVVRHSNLGFMDGTNSIPVFNAEYTEDVYTIINGKTNKLKVSNTFFP